MTTEPLEQAIAATRTVLQGVSSDQFGAETPCSAWTVKELVNHIVGGQHFFALSMEGATPEGEVDFSATDFVSAFDAASQKAVAAFQADGALERTVSLPWGEMPGGAFMGLAITDTLCHGWDLAKATGQGTDLAPELAAGVLEQARASIAPEFRDEAGTVFGPEQPCPDGATNADQLAAFLGRKV